MIWGAMFTFLPVIIEIVAEFAGAAAAESTAAAHNATVDPRDYACLGASGQRSAYQNS